MPTTEGTALDGRWPFDWIVPAWPAPSRVGALMTTRNGGRSGGPWGGISEGGASGRGLNLGINTGDDPHVVDDNRSLLATQLRSRPVWLAQVHGVVVIDADAAAAVVPTAEAPIADASFCDRPGVACAVLVADCLPVLFSNREGTLVAAAHAGWRGLVSGVLEATVARGGFDPDRTLAWIGPGIGPSRFEVGDDVRAAFIETSRTQLDAVAAAFVRHGPHKWLADLPALARLRLRSAGVVDVHSSGLCTASDARRFYSYRRDGVTGRMAALIWIQA